MNEFNFKSYDNSKQSISYCEVDKCPAVIKLRQQLDQLKARSEETIDGLLSVQYQLADNCRKYEQALQYIKDYCNNYPQNSIGFKQQILQKCEVINEQN